MWTNSIKKLSDQVYYFDIIKFINKVVILSYY